MSKTAPIPILDRTVKKCGDAEVGRDPAVTAIAKVHSCSYGLDSQSGVGNHYDLSMSVQKGSLSILTFPFPLL